MQNLIGPLATEYVTGLVQGVLIGGSVMTVVWCVVSAVRAGRAATRVRVIETDTRDRLDADYAQVLANLHSIDRTLDQYAPKVASFSGHATKGIQQRRRSS